MILQHILRSRFAGRSSLHFSPYRPDSSIIRYLAIEMYKCVYGINPPYLNELFTSKDTRYNLRDSNRLQQPEFETIRYGFRSFRYYGSKLWNALPTHLKTSENLHHFKKNITQWCLSGKCDVLIIQWYTWYISLYMKSIVSSYRFYSTVVLSLEVIHPSLPGTAGTGGQVLASLSRPRDLPTR